VNAGGLEGDGAGGFYQAIEQHGTIMVNNRNLDNFAVEFFAGQLRQLSGERLASNKHLFSNDEGIGLSVTTIMESIIVKINAHSP